MRDPQRRRDRGGGVGGESGLLWQSMCCVTATGFVEQRPEACFYHAHARTFGDDGDLRTTTGGHVNRWGNKPSRQDREAAPLTNCALCFRIADLRADTTGRAFPSVQSRASGRTLAGERSVYGGCDSALTCGDDDDGGGKSGVDGKVSCRRRWGGVAILDPIGPIRGRLL